MTDKNIPSIAERISKLFSAMKGQESAENIAKNINDILIYGDKISVSLLSSSWDYFAKRKGLIQ